MKPLAAAAKAVLAAVDGWWQVTKLHLIKMPANRRRSRIIFRQGTRFDCTRQRLALNGLGVTVIGRHLDMPNLSCAHQIDGSAGHIVARPGKRSPVTGTTADLDG
jgi:hypothetical protein